ncbi:AAA family ATPase [Nonomuraea salmonea]|uniref:AAA family ATPase n=1 Tax=Nonomuraea salmonea TaxID=46181 RepID=UPI003CD08705
MRPLRLHLDDFGSFREPATVDFSGVDYFVLVGPTGAGKSTLIDAICFALYGTVPRWGKENVIAHALAPSAVSAKVALVFESAGRRLAVVRALRRDAKGKVHTAEARLDELDPSVPASAELEDLLAAVVRPVAEGGPRSPARCSASRGWSTGSSPSAWCCRRAGSPSSCTPSRANARTCSSSSSTPTSTNASASAPSRRSRPPRRPPGSPASGWPGSPTPTSRPNAPPPAGSPPCTPSTRGSGRTWRGCAATTRSCAASPANATRCATGSPR